MSTILSYETSKTHRLAGQKSHSINFPFHKQQLPHSVHTQRWFNEGFDDDFEISKGEMMKREIADFFRNLFSECTFIFMTHNYRSTVSSSCEFKML